MFRGPRGRLAMPTELPSLNKEITYLLTYLLQIAVKALVFKNTHIGPHFTRDAMKPASFFLLTLLCTNMFMGRKCLRKRNNIGFLCYFHSINVQFLH